MPLALLTALALAGAEPDPAAKAILATNPTMIADPQWTVKPTRVEMSYAYPDRAMMKEKSGDVRLICRVRTDGTVNACGVLEETRPGYRHQLAAEHSVPEAIISFLDAEDFEGSVRNAVSLGGDADTMACIAGAIAEAYWGGVPERIAAEVQDRLPPDLLLVTERFARRYGLASE